ncbi:hypothetical protein PMAYCL1PPCAC_02857, partial [Pristionchus mayeri]
FQSHHCLISSFPLHCPMGLGSSSGSSRLGRVRCSSISLLRWFRWIRCLPVVREERGRIHYGKWTSSCSHWIRRSRKQRIRKRHPIIRRSFVLRRTGRSGIGWRSSRSDVLFLSFEWRRRIRRDGRGDGRRNGIDEWIGRIGRSCPLQEDQEELI